MKGVGWLLFIIGVVITATIASQTDGWKFAAIIVIGVTVSWFIAVRISSNR